MGSEIWQKLNAAATLWTNRKYICGITFQIFHSLKSILTYRSLFFGYMYILWIFSISFFRGRQLGPFLFCWYLYCKFRHIIYNNGVILILNSWYGQVFMLDMLNAWTVYIYGHECRYTTLWKYKYINAGFLSKHLTF